MLLSRSNLDTRVHEHTNDSLQESQEYLANNNISSGKGEVLVNDNANLMMEQKDPLANIDIPKLMHTNSWEHKQVNKAFHDSQKFLKANNNNRDNGEDLVNGNDDGKVALKANHMISLEIKEVPKPVQTDESLMVQLISPTKVLHVIISHN